MRYYPKIHLCFRANIDIQINKLVQN